MEPYNKIMDPSLNWTCGFSPEGPLECLREATEHGFIINTDEEGRYVGLSMMASCRDHAPRMKADYVHPMDSPCGVSGSYFKWPENYCYIPWDEVEQKLKGAQLIEERA